MKLDEFDWFMILGIPVILLIFSCIITYDAQQTRALFQQTYNKNLECRQSLKDLATGRINDICGAVPVIGDFVK